MLLLLGLVLASPAWACSTFIAGKDATVDGSVLTTHSDDGEGNPDPRLVNIAAKDYPGAQIEGCNWTVVPGGPMRPLLPDMESFPREVSCNRTETYCPNNYPEKWPLTNPIGYIPQVKHTYAYIDSNYGVMNERQVSIGETTCSGRFGTKAAGSGGKALLSINELSRIALERCDSSRGAVTLMGQLASKYGFYGAGSFEGSAETLMVGDPAEGFVFHVLPDSTKGGSAIWVGQRVPDDHFTAVDNMFTIRDIDCTDTHNFICSPNIHSRAQEEGLWSPEDGALDFTKAYSNGEYAHKYYSGRRFWRSLMMFAPYLNLNPNYTNIRLDNPYPWSAKPANKLSAHDLMEGHRDWYAGTPFDMSKGLAAGPFGNPDRFKGGPGEAIVQKKYNGDGNWERPIGLFRTTYSFVNQVGGDKNFGTVWFGCHSAIGTCYVPLTLHSTGMPYGVVNGDPNVLDKNTLFWTFRYVENLAHLRFDDMIKMVKEKQKQYEEIGAKLVDRIANMSPNLQASALGKRTIGQMIEAHTSDVIAAWWKLFDDMMMQYADGWLNEPGKTPGTALGYPAWWLEGVGYQNGPPPPPPLPHGAEPQVLELDG